MPVVIGETSVEAEVPHPTEAPPQPADRPQASLLEALAAAAAREARLLRLLVD
ncbi:hypothetical protein [Paracraurococcus ruber]|uniref:hypothetical protein n=1 Tax=Paracraurococcus ruber TaxID=77675 RepID=UPI001305206C|nr:hypothetical protein [Paracraurococcus ruber]